jgi:hypothetical protein
MPGIRKKQHQKAPKARVRAHVTRESHVVLALVAHAPPLSSHTLYNTCQNVCRRKRHLDTYLSFAPSGFPYPRVFGPWPLPEALPESLEALPEVRARVRPRNEVIP